MTDGRALDHVVLAVHDLDAVSARFEQAGFTVTPIAHHGDHMGTSNRLIQYQDRTFIEILTVDRPNNLLEHDRDLNPPFFSFGAHHRDYLAEQQGVSMLVFQTNDARQDLARFDANGYDTYAPFDFGRKATLSDGSIKEVAFSLGFVTSPEMPWLAFFVCENKYPENFWTNGFMNHTNNTIGINTITVESADPVRDGRFVGGLFDNEHGPIAGGYLVQLAGAQRMRFIKPRGSLNDGPTITQIEINGGPFSGSDPEIRIGACSVVAT